MSNVSFNDQQQQDSKATNCHARSFTSENCIHFTVVDEIGSKQRIEIKLTEENLCQASVRNMRDFFMSLYTNGLTCHSD